MTLMKAYLYDRHKRVKVEGVRSAWKLVKTGLPQGSLSGPLLFNLFINDINFFIDEVSIRLYADDTTEYLLLLYPKRVRSADTTATQHQKM